MNTIDYRVEQMAQNELDPPEFITWSASPSPKRLARKTLPIFLFAIPWTAFAIFWICVASGFKIPDFKEGFSFFPLFGIPFVLIGIGLLSSPFWAMRNAKMTGYFITTKRAILIEKRLFPGFKIRSFYPRDLTNIERNQLPDGSGDIILDRELRYQGNNNNTQMKEIGFMGIQNVRDIERRLVGLSE